MTHRIDRGARGHVRRSAQRALNRDEANRETAGLIGRTIVFRYPRANYEHVGLRYETRILRVGSVRDFGSLPADEPAADRDPHLRRLGKLLTGVDLACGEERSFYRGAMKGMHVAGEAEIEELAAKPVTVSVIDRPGGWEPTSVDDLPPNVERHYSPTSFLAGVYAHQFNSLEMNRPTGRWAVR